MSFTVEVNAPEALYWDELVKPVHEALRQARADENQRNNVVRHYAYLLRMRSWHRGLDWNPQQNKIMVEVPNNFSERSTIDKNGVVRDGLVACLQEIYSEITLEKVLQHFQDSTSAR